MLNYIRKKLRKGALSLEMLGILVIMGMFIAFAARQGEQTRQASKAAALAAQLNTIAKGAQSFLDSNGAQLLQKLKVSSTNHIKVDSTGAYINSTTKTGLTGEAAYGLKNYIPAVHSKTAFNQIPALYVFEGPDGALHGLLATTGGIPATGTADEKRLYMDVARTVAGMNGFGMMIKKNNKKADVNAFVGQKNSWTYDPSVDGIARPEEGQLGRMLMSDGAAIKDNMLYRTEVDGHPELNAMQTDFHLNGNQITDTGTITISQNPAIQGSSAIGDVPIGGNGVVIEPATYRKDGLGITLKTGEKTEDLPDYICSRGQKVDGSTGKLSTGKPNGFLFTFDSGPKDKTGLWMCMNNKARLISDSGNSSQFKSAMIAVPDQLINMPICPQNTTPSIFVAPAAFAESKDNPATLVAVQTFAEPYQPSSSSTNPPTKWQIKIRTKSTSNVAGGVTTPNAWTMAKSGDQLNFAIVITSCERN